MGTTIRNNRLACNAAANAMQTLAGAALLFALYRYISVRLGVDQLGVWSVVLASVSVSRLADLGLSAGVVRFVARDRSRDDPYGAAEVIDTASLSLALVMAAALPLLYAVLQAALPRLFDGRHLELAQSILPFGLLSFWLATVSSVFMGGLDGCERMDLRALLVISGQAALLVVAAWLVPAHGLIALAWAQVAQGLLTLIFGRLLLRRALPLLPVMPSRWRWQRLREMLGYGINIQASAAMVLLLDPLTKMLMGAFGGATAAGYFEIANQVVLKVRAVLVAANQAVVPRIAALHEQGPAFALDLYRRHLRLLGVVTLPAFGILIVWSGGFSWLLTGEYRFDLVLMIWLLAVSWGANVFNNPAYFANLGTGNILVNTASHALTAASNLLLGILLGNSYGAFGVVAAYCVSITIGSVFLVGLFHKRHAIELSCLFPKEHLFLACAVALVAILAVLFPLEPASDSFLKIGASIILAPLLLSVAIAAHPAVEFRRLLRKPA